jgi:hypothetical protein
LSLRTTKTIRPGCGYVRRAEKRFGSEGFKVGHANRTKIRFS